MWTFIEETKCTSAACGIIYDLSHHCSALVEEEFVADTYLSGRLYEYVPKAHILIELTKEEHFNLGIRLFLCAPEACRKHLCVIEDECISLTEVIGDILTGDKLLVSMRIYDRIVLIISMIHLYPL